MEHIPYPHIQRKKRPTASEWTERGVKHTLSTVLTADDDGEIIAVVRQCRHMLASLGVNPGDVANCISLGRLAPKMPPELEDDSPVNITTLQLLLNRHFDAVALPGQAAISGAIYKLRSGTPLGAIDHAQIRSAKARARLAMSGAVA